MPRYHSPPPTFTWWFPLTQPIERQWRGHMGGSGRDNSEFSLFIFSSNDLRIGEKCSFVKSLTINGLMQSCVFF